MPFWKKSEDPWDVKPKKQAEVSQAAEPSAPEEEPGAAERFFDALDARLDARAEARREKDAPSVPMTCPWCGRDMEQGYLFGGRGVLWSREKPGMFSMLGDCVPVDTDGDFWSSYKLSWHCPACCRLVTDFHPSGTANGEYSQFQEELQRYAKQAKETELSK